MLFDSLQASHSQISGLKYEGRKNSFSPASAIAAPTWKVRSEYFWNSCAVSNSSPISIARASAGIAGKDGTVYRYNRQTGDWSSNSGNGWQEPNVQRQQPMRSHGA